MCFFEVKSKGKYWENGVVKTPSRKYHFFGIYCWKKHKKTRFFHFFGHFFCSFFWHQIYPKIFEVLELKKWAKKSRKNVFFCVFAFFHQKNAFFWARNHQNFRVNLVPKKWAKKHVFFGFSRSKTRFRGPKRGFGVQKTSLFWGQIYQYFRVNLGSKKPRFGAVLGSKHDREQGRAPKKHRNL